MVLLGIISWLNKLKTPIHSKWTAILFALVLSFQATSIGAQVQDLVPELTDSIVRSESDFKKMEETFKKAWLIRQKQGMFNYPVSYLNMALSAQRWAKRTAPVFNISKRGILRVGTIKMAGTMKS